MSEKQKPLLLGNWKMNPATLAQAKELFVDIRKALRRYNDIEIAIAPPSPYISNLAKLSPSGRIGIMAQDAWYENTGPDTGLVSVPMMQSCGASYVIVGHSEMRARGETNDVVAQKLQAVHKAKLTPVLCIGESERDTEGKFYSVVQEQLQVAFSNIAKAAVSRTIIAYEPVWAIGSGRTPSEQDIEEMRLFIEKCLVEIFSRSIAKKVRIIYGGSVNGQNAAKLFTEGAINGFLVGGASLEAGSFNSIAKAIKTRN